MRKPFTSISLLCARIVAPPAPKQVMTWLVILFTFALSAIFHILASAEVSTCSIYPQIRYYMSTAIAIVLEDVVLSVFRSASDAEQSIRKEKEDITIDHSRKNQSTVRERAKSGFPRVAWRTLGYCWVFGFDMWAVSKLVYSSHKCKYGGLQSVD